MYYKFKITTPSDALAEVVVAHLSTGAFDGFEINGGELMTYISEKDYNETEKGLIEFVVEKYASAMEKEYLEEENWNAQWESDYEPVFVDDFCVVRATFHPPVTTVQHEIVITPKMSFGTGHHQTTYMMMKQMESIDFASKTVFDYGCGTGVLAILALFLGAESADAVDIDTWAYENTIENLEINNCSETIAAYCGDMDIVPTKQYDILLANINRNVLLGNMKAMGARLKKGGYLLCSGFLDTDIEQMKAAAAAEDFELEQVNERESWRCLLFKRTV